MASHISQGKDRKETRKFVDPKIKFEILSASEKEKKCFDFAGLF